MVHELHLEERWIRINCEACSKKYGTPIEFKISVHIDDYSEKRWKQYWNFWDIHAECEVLFIDPILKEIQQLQEEDCAILTQLYAEEGATFASVREKYLTYRKSKVITLPNGHSDIEFLKNLFNPTLVKISAN